MGARHHDRMQAACANLLRTLEGVVDPDVRIALVAERLSRSEESEALDLLGALVAGAEAQSVTHRSALLYACQALHRPAFMSFRSRLCQMAADRAQYAITKMLREQMEEETSSPSKADGEPLGSRKSRARVATRDQIAALLIDPHPQVLAILLDNPKVRVADVVRIAAKRPANQSHLKAIFAHGRWLQQYSVRAALAKNPTTPEPLAHCLLFQLRRNDLREVAQAGAIAEDVRSEASRLLSHAVVSDSELH